MNTYNENLRSIVFDSIQSRGSEQKKLNAQLNAAKVSLYYTQGDRISASEKLDVATDKLATKSAIKEQAVDNSNLSNNVQASANQQADYSKQSVANVATSASNMQIAANAILKLASDVGSIFSIVNAADYGADIFTNAQNVKSLMDQTAYEAEVASQKAMIASAETAEIPFNKMDTQAKLTNSALKNMLEVSSAEYDKMTAEVTADSAALAADSNKEKVAQGKLEDIYVDSKAANDAYTFINSELNLDLKVAIINPNNPTDPEAISINKAVTPSQFQVNFNSILSPFQGDNSPLTYPVDNYYLILVKNSKRKTFSIEDAEALTGDTAPDGENYFIKVQMPDEAPTGGSSIPLQAIIDTSSIYDSDKDKFSNGENYVVFVYAEYDDKYKRLINDFENFLSAPSSLFNITTTLATAIAANVNVKTTEHAITLGSSGVDLEEVQGATATISLDSSKTSAESVVVSKLEFTINKNANENLDVQHRCMFLPVAEAGFTMSTLTHKALELQSYLASYEKQVAKSEGNLSALNAQLAAAKKSYNALKQEADKGLNLKHTKQQIAKLEAKKRKTKADTDKLAELQEHLKLQEELTPQVEAAAAKVKDLQQKVAAAGQATDALEKDQLNFFFDLDLAEQVSAANYFSPTAVASDDPNMDKYALTINSAITDNFGTPLVEGESYVPLILTVSAADEADLDQFTNAMTDYENTSPFKYQTVINS